MSSVPGVVEFAESNGMNSTQVACVQLLQEFSDKEMIELRNGTDKAREGILVSLFGPCAQLGVAGHAGVRTRAVAQLVRARDS